MKTFENGAFTDSDGPPLPHDEWVKEQARLQDQEQKNREQQARQRASARTASRQTADADGDDLDSLTVAELKDRARDAQVEGFSTMHKAELVEALRNGGSK